MPRLAEITCLVTGEGDGIGRATAHRLVDEGAGVVLVRSRSAGLAAFRASGDSDYITGQYINVDRGMVFELMDTLR